MSKSSIYDFEWWGYSHFERFIPTVHKEYSMKVRIFEDSKHFSFSATIVGIRNMNISYEEYKKLYRENWEIHEQMLLLEKLGS